VSQPHRPPKRLRRIDVRYEETSDVGFEKVIILPNRASIPVKIPDIFPLVGGA
jgi:hypothetical protein